MSEQIAHPQLLASQVELAEVEALDHPPTEGSPHPTYEPPLDQELTRSGIEPRRDFKNDICSEEKY